MSNPKKSPKLVPGSLEYDIEHERNKKRIDKQLEKRSISKLEASELKKMPVAIASIILSKIELGSLASEMARQHNDERSKTMAKKYFDQAIQFAERARDALITEFLREAKLNKEKNKPNGKLLESVLAQIELEEFQGMHPYEAVNILYAKTIELASKNKNKK